MYSNVTAKYQSENKKLSARLDKECLLSILPQEKEKIDRAYLLLDKERLPTVTVVGKYNHGKSSLLNVLVEDAYFGVSDIRHTRSLEQIESKGVLWLDAPGLDADTQLIDDQHAYQATWLESDIRLFVHAATEGELDAAELELLDALLEDEKNSQRTVLFVLTQVDQLASDEQLATIIHNIEQQVQNIDPIPVSAMRYQRGLEREQPLFIEKSGIAELQDALANALGYLPRTRQAERHYLLDTLAGKLDALITERQQALNKLRTKADEQENLFETELRAVLEQANIDLQDIMQEPDFDHALDPGTIDDVYKVTAGKIERSKIQNAYSRTCIHIRSVLTRHGVMALPKGQQTGTRSLDTVMVAVLGVSVKYRADLRRLFGMPEGRERLFNDFKSYFSRSLDRQQLMQNIARLENDWKEAIHASEELKKWADLM